MQTHYVSRPQGHIWAKLFHKAEYATNKTGYMPIGMPGKRRRE